MILQNAIEDIQMEFSGAKEAYLKKQLNTIQKEFCRKTGIITGKVIIAKDDPSWKSSNNEATLNLESKNISRVNELKFVDSNGNTLDEPAEIELDINDLRLIYPHKISDMKSESGFETLEIEAVLIPSDIENMTDAFTLEDDFMEGVIAKVKEKLSAKQKDYPSASYYRGVYKDTVLEAIRQVNEGKDGRGLEVDLNFI